MVESRKIYSKNNIVSTENNSSKRGYIENFYDSCTRVLPFHFN